MEIEISAPIEFYNDFEMSHHIEQYFEGVPYIIERTLKPFGKWNNTVINISIPKDSIISKTDIINRLIGLIGLCHHDGCCRDVKVVSFKDK